MISTEKIELHGPDKKNKGIKFNKILYEKISELIVLSIKEQPKCMISFDQLIEVIMTNIDNPGIEPWHIMQVKISLQQKGAIKITHNQSRRQFIELNKSKRRPLYYNEA